MPNHWHTPWLQGFSALPMRLAGQFHHLNLRTPAEWPAAPRLLLCTATAALGMALAWWLHLSHYAAELEAMGQQERLWQERYREKLAKAAHLAALQQQRTQAQAYVAQREKQLPSKTEMAALLSGIHQGGQGRGGQFELFRPGTVVLRDYYAELPIAVRLSGSYHDMGIFAAELAQLPYLVTLGDIRMARVDAAAGSAPRPGPGHVVIDATVLVFRALDGEEVAAQKAAASHQKGGG
jgi:type IV pilus assembly protein PilO